MKKIAVLASGHGSNFEAIMEAVNRGDIAGEVVLLVSDRENAPVLEKGRKYNVETLFLDPKSYGNRLDFDQAMEEKLKAARVDLIVLAGYMRLLSSRIISAFPMQIMNIHPSLLPAFPGLNGVEQALAYGVKVTGCTVHFVDEGLDSGPVILQESVPVIQRDTAQTLQQRIHAAEHRIYPTAVDLYCRDKLRVEGRRCLILG